MSFSVRPLPGSLVREFRIFLLVRCFLLHVRLFH